MLSVTQNEIYQQLGVNYTARYMYIARFAGKKKKLWQYEIFTHHFHRSDTYWSILCVIKFLQEVEGQSTNVIIDTCTSTVWLRGLSFLLKHLPRPSLYCEILRACFMGLNNCADTPEELKWAAFTYLKVFHVLWTVWGLFVGENLSPKIQKYMFMKVHLLFFNF